jgi:hypothetical protein
MGHFWWIMSLILLSVALGSFVHPVAIAVPMLLWLAVEFFRAEYTRRRRQQELEQMQREQEQISDELGQEDE